MDTKRKVQNLFYKKGLLMSKGGNWLLRAQTVRLCFYFSVTRTSANGQQISAIHFDICLRDMVTYNNMMNLQPPNDSFWGYGSIF